MRPPSEPSVNDWIELSEDFSHAAAMEWATLRLLRGSLFSSGTVRYSS